MRAFPVAEYFLCEASRRFAFFQQPGILLGFLPLRMFLDGLGECRPLCDPEAVCPRAGPRGEELGISRRAEPC